jgi:hypothetical protein
MSPHVRTVKTSSGATAVQIVYSNRRGSRTMEHLGSAHTDAEVELLKAAGRQKLAAGQGELDLGLNASPAAGGPLPITSTRMGHLWDALEHAYRVLGFEQATGGDGVFRDLVLARIIEPTSKVDSARVLEEVGVPAASYPTLNRRLPAYAKAEFRSRLAAACARQAGLGPATLVLYDVTTLYFETDQGDGFREPGFSKERRLEPQITIGLLTDGTGFPLMVEAFEGNKAETATMLPVIKAFKDAHQLHDVIVVADAGMVSEANKKAIEAEGLWFILGARIPDEPYVVQAWRKEHEGEQIPDGHIFTQPWPASPTDGRRDHVFYYQYRHDRARRTLKGIDEQVAKAENAVAGKAPVKRNRFIALTGATKSVNRALEAKARALAGGQGVRHQPARRRLRRLVRDRRLPPAVADREVVPDVQARSAGPPDLPPHQGLHRGPPDRGVRRPGRDPVGRGPDRVVHQEVRPHRPPLPHHPDPGRRADHHRSRPPTRRPHRRPPRNPPRQRWALVRK